MLDTNICIDTGNSGTKIVYINTGAKEPKPLFMSSALVEQVEARRLDNELQSSSWIGFPSPEQQAWMKIDDSFAVVGELAEKFSFTDRRKISKYQNALYKVLAAIGVIVQSEFEHTKKRLKVKLGLLLPWNEYKDRERLFRELEIILPEYEFRGNKVRVLLERKNFFCHPEGGGIAMARVKSNGLDWFKKERVGVLMLGDRNWTGLYFESGKVKKGASPLEGFSFLLDQIIESSPGILDREILKTAIFKAITEETERKNRFQGYNWSESEAIQSLSTATKESLRKSEISDIDSAIELTAKIWFEKLESFIVDIFPKKITEMNVCGGASLFFRPFIENHFNCVVNNSTNQNCLPINMAEPYTKVFSNGGITETVAKALNFDSVTSIESAFSTRFADVFCFIEFMAAEDKKLAKQIK